MKPGDYVVREGTRLPLGPLGRVVGPVFDYEDERWVSVVFNDTPILAKTKTLRRVLPEKHKWSLKINEDGQPRLERSDGVVLACLSGNHWCELTPTGGLTADGPEVYDLQEALDEINRVRGL